MSNIGTDDGIKAQLLVAATDATAQHLEPDVFTWNSCGYYDDQKRIKIKEEALEVGLLQCGKLIQKLESSSLNSTRTSDSLVSTSLGWTDVEKWIQKCKALIATHKEFKVLVGVAGPTGSGKTSALNALLRLRGFLATNSQEAATAVPCKVSYNDDDRPWMKYKACVVFRTKTNLVKQLNDFFQDLKTRDELQAAYTDNIDYDALEDIGARLTPTLEMIRAVFGLEEESVAKMTTQTLLNSNPGVVKLLGVTKKFHGNNLDQVSEQIKPYIDSTTADHTTSNSEFAAWPLIDEVEIFVKSDILRNGVVLVDLPGLCDWVESRAAVAKGYFHKLAATLIVSPAVRAADNSTSMRLLSDHKGLCMTLDGKFNKRSCCVAISQIDDIERDSALRSQEAKLDTELQQLLEKEKTLKQTKKDQESQLTRAEKELKRTKTALNKAANKRSKPSYGVSKKKSEDPQLQTKKLREENNIMKLKEGLTKIEGELDGITNHIVFQCVKNRNRFLENRIQRDFQRRRSSLIPGDEENKDIRDDVVSVCPFSSKAFWGYISGEKSELVAGFPDERYSGIPNLSQWIREATIPDRESHAQRILHDLHGLYNTIRTWSENEWSHSRLQIDKEWVVQEVLPSLHGGIKKELGTYWTELNESVKNCNPLERKKVSIGKCVEECDTVVKNWVFKDPAKKSKIHWTTYQANIVRNGGEFSSKSAGGLIKYHWMQDVSDVLLRTIVADWHRAFHEEIPEVRRLACDSIDTIWDAFLEQLQAGIKSVIPELSPPLAKIMPDLRVIKEQVKERVKQALEDIIKNASKVHPEIVDSIQGKWSPVFQEAGLITGDGSFLKRREHLAKFPRNNGTRMFNAAFDNTKNKLKEHFDQFPASLANISKFAIEEVEDQIKTALNSAMLPNNKIEEALKEKLELQKDVRSVLIEWDFKWKAKGTIRSHHTEGKDTSIPDTYCPTRVEEDSEDEEDEDKMEIDDEGPEDKDADELAGKS
ncbi:hypothetical protein F4813DRAFT_392184 [Daldinia decipiens]|uniref:uncharacterized protein n=1 Tax=Daldinia decipiens TaxID=326647 RepID=UPI0020C56840|nr:uncharacterized protein F4813DRAFT_392184 [Daldinia decipiens]KAI1654934.1 hypothetical protein F4813DRAFT_392184 [Daldinia decipiens]